MANSSCLLIPKSASPFGTAHRLLAWRKHSDDNMRRTSLPVDGELSEHDRSRLFNALNDGRYESVRNLLATHAACRSQEQVNGRLMSSNAALDQQFFRTLVLRRRSGKVYDEKPPRHFDGATALHVASWRGHRDIVEWLLGITASARKGL